MSETPSRAEGSVRCLAPEGFHRLAYTAWGEPDPVRCVVCVHGITGNARDFDALASALVAGGHWVVCPDVVGRGRSEALANPRRYVLKQYVSDMTTLLARLDVDVVDWVGTSMGGMIGMAIAGLRGSPIRRLVLNDIGPFVPRAAVQRLAGHVGTGRDFPDLAAVEAYLRDVRAPYGDLSDEEWRAMAERSAVGSADGGWRLAYDPAVGVPLREGADRDVDLWASWDAIRCPVRVLRGEDSDLLLRETAEEMASRGPRADVVMIPERGHAPTLASADQIGLVVDWLG